MTSHHQRLGGPFRGIRAVLRKQCALRSPRQMSGMPTLTANNLPSDLGRVGLSVVSPI